MSHHDTARLDASRLACEASCDLCERRVSDVLARCEALEARSEKVVDADMRADVSAIRGRCGEILDSVRSFSALPVEERTRRASSFREEVRALAREAGSALVTTGDLAEQAEQIFERRMEEAAAGTGARDDLEEALRGVSDGRVAHIARMLARNPSHRGETAEGLVDMARRIADPSLPRSEGIGRAASDAVSSEMRDSNIEPDGSEEPPASPLDALDRCGEAVVDESVRRSAVAAISKSVSSMGFVVDRRSIRIDRAENVVRMTARKPAGQRAEFAISLDGRFAYRFDGYEGLACEKDIGKMTEDLERVYGIKVEEVNTVWRNPDKTASMHHAEMKAGRMRGCRYRTR